MVDGLQVDGQCTTTAAGVFAAGDLSGQMQSVANAVAAGSNAAAMVVRSLVDDDHGPADRSPAPARRHAAAQTT